MNKDLRRVFNLLPSRLQWRWLALLPLVIAAAAVEAATAAAVFALLSLLSDPAPVRLAAWLPQASDWSPRAVVLAGTAAVMLLYLARLLALAVVTLVKDVVAQQSVVVLSGIVLRGYLSGPFAAVSLQSPSVMMQRIQRGTEAVVSQGLLSIVHLAAEAAVVIALVVVLALSAPLITLFAVVATAALLLLPAMLSKRIAVRWGEREKRHQEQLLQHLRQGLGALREIRIYGRERFFRERVMAARDALSLVQRRRLLLSDTIRLVVETTFVLVLLLVVGAVAWVAEGAQLVSLLGLFAYAGFRLVPSANRITLNLNSARGALPVARDIADDVRALALRVPDQLPAAGTMAFAHEVVFEGVTHHYPGTTEAAVEDINLTIRRGESIGIVGASGSGKSTTIDILVGLVEPSAGRVLVDGHDVRHHLRSWQRQIGYVAQSFYLLDDTLRNNIAFGLGSAEIDENRLAEAVAAASLDDLVASLPDGINTRLGEQGARLSGGERQRVAIARALYARPAVLIFDEATAALDPQTERDVIDAIAALRGERTVVVIAHRISTVRSCDRIIMLRDGRVHATGQFEILLREDGAFRALLSGDESLPDTTAKLT